MIKLEKLWDVNAWLITKCLEGYEGDDWRKRPEGSNSAIWILGHTVTCRMFLARLLGLDLPEAEWESQFEMNSDPDKVSKDLTGESLMTEFAAVHEKFSAHLTGFDEAALDAAIEEEFPEMPKTLLGALHFLFLHESYHVGQLGMNRVMLGKGSWMKNIEP